METVCENLCVSQRPFFAILAYCLLAPWIGGSTALAQGLPQEVYVWQRARTDSVRRAVVEHGAAFARVIVLNAEVTWRQGQPQLAKLAVEYGALAQAHRPIGLALRIGPYPGPFGATNLSTVYLADVAREIVAEARAAQINPSELQLDFDCASSKLDSYRSWVERIRARVAPVPVVITALPVWLEQPAFKALAQAADGYVLQVHSLERPTTFDAPFTLCDPAAARRAVAKASALGVPFRVALPTYGYLVAFGGGGRFLGLSAEGPARSWPADARLKEVRAEPLEMARLAREWSSNPPAGLAGIIWYRLPVEGDTLNWRWPTLNAILQARSPRKSVRGDSHRVEAGLVEISLVNDGELDISSRLAVQTRWRDGRLLAGDGLHGFVLAERRAASARFETGVGPYRLPAGERQVIGWLRLSQEDEVQGEIKEVERER